MILKLTSSLKAVQLIDDDGTVYQTGLHQLKRYIEAMDSGKFLLLAEMPFKAQPGKFPKSEVYTGPTTLDLTKLNTPSFDALGAVHKKKAAEEQVVEDTFV